MIRLHKPLVHVLDIVGDGSGTTNAIGDYSTPTEFKFVPAVGDTVYIERLLIVITDGAILADGYGGLGALTNGIKLEVTNSTIVYFSFTPEPIKRTSHWGKYSYDSNLLNFKTTNESFLSRWTFTNFGDPIRVTNDKHISVTLQDNMTGLVEHYFTVEGFYLNHDQ